MRTSFASLIVLTFLSPLALAACGAAAPNESASAPPACAGKVSSDGKCEGATGTAAGDAKSDSAEDSLAAGPPPPPPNEGEKKEDTLPATRSPIIQQTESAGGVHEEGGVPSGGAPGGAGSKSGSDKGPGRGCQPNDPLCMFNGSGSKQ